MSQLKVPELKKQLADLGLPQSGTKADLITRIIEHEEAQNSQNANGGKSAKGTEVEEDLLG